MSLPEPDERCKQIFAGCLNTSTGNWTRRLAKRSNPFEGCTPCIEFLESFRKSIEICRDCSPSVAPKPLDPARRKELRTAWHRMCEAGRSREPQKSIGS
jgi:hypothetical protein